MRVNMQQSLTILGTTKPLETVSSELISKCKTKLDAVRLMVQLSNMSNEHICSATGIQPAQFTRIMQGRANLPTDNRYTMLLQVCGNTAVIQWEAMQFGFDLVSREQVRIKELEEELKKLKSA